MNQKVQDALNTQINAELHSAYIYLSMSAHFEEQSLSGMAQWMRLQAQEEMEHAMRLYDFVHTRGGRVILEAVEGPPTEWGTPVSIFEAALAHEKKITGMIHDLYALATEEKDYPTQSMLQWFVDEQVEEEDNVGTVVDQLKMVSDDLPSLLLMDRELGARKPEEEGEE
ncbi:ferritin [Gemmatimonadota bacterium]